MFYGNSGRQRVTAGLRQFDTRRRFITSPVTAAVSDERRRSALQHITPLLRQLHWLKAPERIAFKQSVLVYKCLHGSAPAYLPDELCQVADGFSSATPFQFIFIIDCQPHTTPYRR